MGERIIDEIERIALWWEHQQGIPEDRIEEACCAARTHDQPLVVELIHVLGVHHEHGREIAGVGIHIDELRYAYRDAERQW
jgi:hypothetical protein